MAGQKTPWVTRWGRDSSSWNIIELSEEEPEEDEEGGDSDGSGLPGRWMVIEAVGRWALTQPTAPTAEVVAAMFNLPLWMAQDIMTATGVCGLGQAVQVWSALQDQFGETVTVGDAATAFHLSPALIADAVQDHHWMYLNGDRTRLVEMTIGHEGE